jgi:transposase
MAATATGYTTERLDHLGIVAGVCREIGLAAYLDALDERQHERVGVGAATVAMVLNGLGFSNRRLYLVSQFFANKPVAHLLGAGIAAEDLNDECLGRTLDWLYAHDPTALFAGLAAQARRVFGIQARQLHVDTTSFAVSGAYLPEGGDLDAQAIAITYGYSRDHREDLKQWMLALATTHDGDIPVFLRPLDGNASDQVSLAEVVMRLLAQVREAGEEAPGLYVVDSGGYSEANMRAFNAAGVRWLSRVPETSTEAKAAVAAAAAAPDAAWQARADGTVFWIARRLTLGQGEERWLVVRTPSGEERARARLTRQVAEQHERWQRRLWHLGHQDFACQADAEAALARLLKEKGRPAWLQVTGAAVARPHYVRRGRPRRDTAPDAVVWRVQATPQVTAETVAREIRRQACFIVATNVLEAAELADEEVIQSYTHDQGGVERGFAFLKDPLFLASSVFLKKPARIVALSFIMVLCLLVYRLAEHRLRQRLAATGQTVPNQLKQPTQRPTLRWIFQCFEGIDRLTVQTPAGSQVLVLHLAPLHAQVLTLLGPPYREIYHLTH